MSVIVTDDGFAPDDWQFGYLDPDLVLDDASRPAVALDLANDADLAPLSPVLDRIDLIRITFPGFADGRGFSLARELRLMGYAGRLRAAGHVIADQYAMARRAGFDEVEIDDALAARQTEDQWRDRADWRENDLRAPLRQID